MSKKRSNGREAGIDQDLNNAEHAIKKDFGRRGKRKGSKRSAAGSDSASETSFCGTNDPKWYGLNQQLLQDAGNLSFNWPMGIGMPLVTTGAQATDPYSVPGVMRVNYISTVGESAHGASPVNVAKNRLFSYVRHMNSGAKNYDPVDLMMYVLAIKSACETYTQCVRAYGVANVYAQSNRYLPDALLQAMGFQPANIRENLANFRYALGVYAAKLNSTVVPATFSLFARASWLTSNVFKDAPTIKSQAYVMKPLYYYKFVEKTTTGLGYLEAAEYPTLAQTGQWLQILEDQLSRIIGSEDCGIMGGDIEKAYGAGGLLSVPAPAENYVVLPIYDEEALVQLTNAQLWNDNNFLGVNVQMQSCNITQDSAGNLIFRPCSKPITDANALNGSIYLRNRKKLLTLRTDTPTPADVMVASRLMYGSADILGTSEGQTNIIVPQAYGTELPTSVDVFRFGEGELAGSWVLKQYELDGFHFSSTTAAKVSALHNLIDLWTKFDWAPALRLVNYGTTAGIYNTDGILLDCDNYVPISDVELTKLHNTAILSLLDVPALSGDAGKIGQ